MSHKNKGETSKQKTSPSAKCKPSPNATVKTTKAQSLPLPYSRDLKDQLRPKANCILVSNISKRENISSSICKCKFYKKRYEIFF